MRNIILMGLIHALLSGLFAAQADSDKSVSGQKQYLWQTSAPYAAGNAEKDKPFLDYYPAVKNPGKCAIIVCPGGGYGNLALDHEGLQVAKWLNGIGVSACILNYRHNGKGYQHPAPLSDAQRAIRFVRYNAKDWGIDPNKIGILGFSAGGHLASSAGTHYQKSAYEIADDIDKTSCRPDFMILVYPVITFESPFAHMGSRKNLLGDNPSENLIKEFSNHLQITKDTPPTFLVHANDDKGVPPENSIMFYEALRGAGVPAEMHIFLKGGHGFGMRKNAGPAENWINLCENWMKASGYLQ